jgi:phosphoglycolate phosphatase (TIGR01487 family)
MSPRSTVAAPRWSALVTDIDGTLTDERRRLDPGAIGAVRALQSSGVPVILATGNVLPIALAIHRSLGLSAPLVAENGGLLYERVGERDVVHRLARRAPALAAYRRLRRAGLPVRRLFTDRWRETEVALEPNLTPAQVRTHLHGSGVSVEATGYALHLMERGCGKRPALARVLGARGLTLADCVVAGDGDNDVPMLRAAGLGLSFANGSPRARRAADHVARAGFADGFVEALKKTGVLPR